MEFAIIGLGGVGLALILYLFFYFVSGAWVTVEEDRAIMDQPAMSGVVEEVTISSEVRKHYVANPDPAWNRWMYTTCEVIYVQIDGKIYVFDDDGGDPIPAEGEEILYRVNGDRIIDVEQVDVGETAERGEADANP